MESNVSIGEIVAEMSGRYYEMVKPSIESGNYESAYWELRDILYVLNKRREEVYSEIHCGLGYLVAMEKLLSRLKNPSNGLDFKVRIFEVRQAQTKLPLKKPRR